MNLQIEKATKRNIEQLTKIEDDSFGVHIIDEEIQLIWDEDLGEIYFAKDGDHYVGYLVVLLKPYDQDVETYLQPILRQRKEKGEKIMHDDVEFDPSKYVYFHLLGVINDYQSKGVGKFLLREITTLVSSRYPKKKIKVCIRINNLPSIRVCMHELKVYLESIKPNRYEIIGSVESNFNAIGNHTNNPILDFEHVCRYEIVNIKADITSDLEKFLIPVEYGEEDVLEDGQLKGLLTDVFNMNYHVVGLVRNKDKSYFVIDRKK